MSYNIRNAFLLLSSWLGFCIFSRFLQYKFMLYVVQYTNNRYNRSINYIFNMLQRSYLESEVQSLYAQNSFLKERVRKISQIQPYVQLLLQNNRKYQEDVKDLQTENNKLRGRVDSILQQTILLKQAHKNQTAQIRNGFETDIERLIRELKDILRDKQAMQDANKSLIEQLTNRCKRDLDNKKRHIEQVEMDSARKISKLNEVIKGKQKIIQQISWEMTDKQVRLLEELDQANYKINLLIKDKEHLEKQIDGLGQQKRTLIKKNKELSKQNQQVSTKWLKSDQEKSQNLLQLKNKNIQMVRRNDQIQQKNRVQEKFINELNRKINHLTKQCDDVSNLKNQVEGSLRRTMRALQQLKAEHAQIVGKLDLVSKTSENQMRRQGQQIDKLTDDNKRLNRQNVELISENKDKISQIQDLIRAIQKLERKLADVSQKCQIYEQQNIKKGADIKSLEQKLQDTLLQKKSLTQKINLYSTHNSTLEQMLQKQKRRNVCLETSRFQIQTIAMGALSKPEEICRQYERQIQKIVQQFAIQKQQVEKIHDSQIINLKSAYEQALKQKDEYFNRKIIFLQKQLNTLRTLR